MLPIRPILFSMRVHLDFATTLFLYWVGMFMPFMAWVSYRMIKRGEQLAPKVERFRLGTGLLIVTGLMALAAAQRHEIRVPLQPDYMGLLFGTAILTGLLVGIARNRHKQPAAHRERIRMLYAPGSFEEFAWASAAGIAAGITEEIAYRVVLYELIGAWAGYAVSIVVCVLLFVLAHLPQGLRGAIGVGAMAILFHCLYAITGSLLPCIVVHALYDVGLFAILLVDERRHVTSQPALFS